MKKLGIALIVVVGLIIGGLIAVLVIGINAGGWSFMDLGNAQGKAGVMELANRQEWSARDLKKLDVAYSSDTLKIYESDGDTIVLEEYFSRWDWDMLAETAQEGGELTIRGGKRKWQMMMLFFFSEVRLYVPRDMAADVVYATNSGSIKSDVDMKAKSFDISATSGSLRFAGLAADGAASLRCNSGGIHADSIAAKDVELACTSGSIRVDEATADTLVAGVNSGGVHIGTLTAAFQLSTTSGSVNVDSAAGGGTATAHSGGVRLDMRELTGDLALSTTSGSVNLTVPGGTGMDFYGKVGSGSIHTDFDGALQYSENHKEASGKVGDAPYDSVRCEAGSGSVRVRYN